ncbi:MAG TPA: ester cyclase [Jatrophihabitans sp.]|jgi:steroid delta-isomerase-like uncharacterized protein|nr:ester cyclase [Jatrophihabitans sp.]
MTTPAENKALVQRFFDEVVNQRNIGAIGDFVAAGGNTCGGRLYQDIVSDPEVARLTDVSTQTRERLVPEVSQEARGGERRGGHDTPDDASNVDAWRDFTEHVLSAFPDMRVEIESMVAEDDVVAVRWKARGTHAGEFLGTPATGRVVPMSNVDHFTIRDGKITAVVSNPDAAGVLHALGHLPTTPLARALGMPGDQEPRIGRPR